MMTFARDLALTARGLRKQPAFALAVVLTSGLGVAATGIVAAAADRALLRPLPFRDPSQVLLLWERSKGGDIRLASYPTFLDWQRASRLFAGLGYVRGTLGLLRTSDGPVQLTAAYVSPGFLRLLGAQPELGRLFAADEELPGRGETVVLSDKLWRRQFDADPRVIGRTLELSGRSVTVVGVMPAGATYPPWTDLWRPIAAVVDTDKALASRHFHSDSRVVGRLRPGVTPAAAMADLAAVQRHLTTDDADQGFEWNSADSKPLNWEIVGNSAPALGALAGAVGLVLLVACVNIATLLLLRAISRERELAIRSALGARHRRLVGLMVLEAGLLGAVATSVALLLTWWGLSVLRVAAPTALPRAVELSLDWRVIGLVLTLGTITTALAALAPAARALRGQRIESLRAGWQPTSGGRTGGRLRATLACTQLALALTLLAGAGLLLESFRRLRDVDLGFDAENLSAFWISPPSPTYEAPERAAALYERLVQAVAEVPGVQSVAIANHVPLAGGWIPTNVRIPGRTPLADGSDVALYKTVSENYLRVMRSRLVRGRWFTTRDMRDRGTAVVVNETMARRFWPNADPVGQPLTIFRSSQARPGFGDPQPSVVVGVIGDMHHLSVADDPVPEVYVPYTREVWPGIGLLIRSSGDPRRLEPALRRAVSSVEPDIPTRGGGLWRGFHRMDEFVDQNLAARRSVMSIVLVFAASALALAAIGVYGVIAFGVAQRSREFGIRMAVGATPGSVHGLVLRQASKLAAVGVVAGIAAAATLTRVLHASLDPLLYRTSPLAVVPFGIAAVGLGAVAIAAAWVPARRAARVDPVVALRGE